MVLLGHISATMSLRYGRLFGATGKAEYEGTDRGERPPGSLPAEPPGANLAAGQPVTFDDVATRAGL